MVSDLVGCFVSDCMLAAAGGVVVSGETAAQPDETTNMVTAIAWLKHKIPEEILLVGRL